LRIAPESSTRLQLRRIRAISLFFDCAADFSQVFTKAITGIGCSLFQIPRKLQLFPQRVPAFDRLRLMPFPLPDFVLNAKQFIDTLGPRK